MTPRHVNSHGCSDFHQTCCGGRPEKASDLGVPGVCVRRASRISSQQATLTACMGSFHRNSNWNSRGNCYGNALLLTISRFPQIVALGIPIGFVIGNPIHFQSEFQVEIQFEFQQEFQVQVKLEFQLELQLEFPLEIKFEFQLETQLESQSEFQT